MAASDSASPAAASSLAHASVAHSDAGVHALRGLALVLLVSFHSEGLGAAQLSPVAMRFHDALSFVRMPLFAAVSGWVFALRPPQRGLELPYLRKRGRRLLLPILPLSLAVMFLATQPLRLAWPPSFAAALSTLLLPRPLIWFVQALLLITAFAVVLERTGALSTRRRWGAIAALTLLLPTLLPPTLLRPAVRHDWFGGSLYLAGYFLLGVGLQRFDGRLVGRRALPWLLALLAGGVAAQQLVRSARLDLVAEKGTPISLLVGVPAIVLLFRVRHRLRGLAWLGPCSLTIYLYHGEIGNLVRLALLRLPLRLPEVTVYGLIFAASLLLPALAHHTLARWAPTRLLLLGLR